MPLAFTNRGVKGCLDIFAAGRELGSTKLAAAITRGALTLAVLCALLLVAAHPAHAQTETVLYNFNPGNGTDGYRPAAGLIMDKGGNLYGNAAFGVPTNICEGTYGCGTVFKVTPGGEESVLYGFCSQQNCVDGSQPYAGLIMDTNGNLYGTTNQGGADGYGSGGNTEMLAESGIVLGYFPIRSIGMSQCSSILEIRCCCSRMESPRPRTPETKNTARPGCGRGLMTIRAAKLRRCIAK